MNKKFFLIVFVLLIITFTSFATFQFIYLLKQPFSIRTYIMPCIAAVLFAFILTKTNYYMNAAKRKSKLLDESNKRVNNQKEKLLDLNKSLNIQIAKVEKYTKQKKILFQKEKLISLGSLTEELSCELEKSLTIMGSFGDKIFNYLYNSKDGNHDLKESFEYFSDARKNMSYIVNGLVEVAQNRHHKYSFDLTELVKVFSHFIAELYKVLEISIFIQIPDNPIYVYGSSSQFKQVLLNLVTNSKEALEQVENKEIYITLIKHEEKAELRIKDNGCGIDKSIQDRVFESYFGVKEQSLNSGMGLSIVRDIISELKGVVKLSSDVTSGCEVCITLPVDINHNLTYKPENAYLEFHGFSAIVMGDEYSNNHDLVQVLEGLSIHVRFFSNARDAYISYCNSSKKIDFIFTAGSIKLSEGISFINKIRQNIFISQPKIILLTHDLDKSYSKVLDLDNGLTDACLSKPYSKKDTIKLINSIVQQDEEHELRNQDKHIVDIDNDKL